MWSMEPLTWELLGGVSTSNTLAALSVESLEYLPITASASCHFLSDMRESRTPWAFVQHGSSTLEQLCRWMHSRVMCSHVPGAKHPTFSHHSPTMLVPCAVRPAAHVIQPHPTQHLETGLKHSSKRESSMKIIIVTIP